ADELDRERAQGRIRGPLHGIPVALKDNVHTTEMPTTGGALAFDGFVPPYEATLAKNLRDAGVIIIAKTGMTELANWVSSNMPGDYNGLKGYGMNPYDPRKDPRPATFDGRPVMQTGGSSSGIGTAADFWAANVGTETSGSILSPSNQNMLAAVKPTVGRVSRYGVIPITADQDTPGPMAKFVVDAAIMLGALEGNNPDAHDAATRTCTAPPNHDYTQFLRKDGLKGARIGIPRAFFYTPTDVPGSDRPRGGLNPAQTKVMEDAIAVLKAQGAVIVDPADIPSVVDKDPKENFLLWGICSGLNNARGKDENCSIDLKYGMKRDFNAWLQTLGPKAPVKSLTELREWNTAHEKAGAIKYGQSQLDISDEMDVERDRPRWEADRAKDIRLGGTHGIDEVMKANHLDALLFPGPNGAAIAARPGYPTVIVPFGMVPNAPFNANPNAPQGNAFPPGLDPKPQPFGVSFTGMACSEPKLLELGYAFEQATRKRTPPASVQ
ncbi:MAG TPA: amidase family protein, partial [Vicinamibacterales bacterium]|nr:amidase family protein [Vicinamibacterales bacterium]